MAVTRIAVAVDVACFALARLYRFIGRLDIVGPPPAEAIDPTVGLTAGKAGRG